MTHQEYLTIFTKHLYVGSTKRTELIDELRTHLEELDAKESPEVKLGNPRQLARRYNHEHLGLLGSVGFMYSLPICIVLLFTAFFSASSYWNQLPQLSYLGLILFVGIIIFTPIWVTFKVSQMHHAKRKIFLYVLVTPILAATTLTMLSFILHSPSDSLSFVDVLAHQGWTEEPQSGSAYINDQFSTALSIVLFVYSYSLIIFLGTLLVLGIKKLNVSIFPKAKK